jgi:hypothetical protein
MVHEHVICTHHSTTPDDSEVETDWKAELGAWMCVCVCVCVDVCVRVYGEMYTLYYAHTQTRIVKTTQWLQTGGLDTHCTTWTRRTS